MSKGKHSEAEMIGALKQMEAGGARLTYWQLMGGLDLPPGSAHGIIRRLLSC